MAINWEVAQQVSDALDAANVPVSSKPFIMAQTAFETGGWNSRVSQDDNNYSGIKYSKNGYGSVGVQSPEGDHYAHYDNPVDWANDLLRILSFDFASEGKPIDANSMDDYAYRLKANGYFGADLDAYTNGLNSEYNQISTHYPGLFLVSTISEAANDAASLLGINSQKTKNIGGNVIIATMLLVILAFLIYNKTL